MRTAVARIIAHLRTLGNPRDVEGQRRYGIAPQGEHLGIRAPVLRKIVRQHRRKHALALKLWASGIHEAMVLATLIDDPKQITRGQMERWVCGCDNWAQTDALAFLFDRTEFAEEKARSWSARKAEFVKRCGFALMASMAVHRKELPDKVFLRSCRSLPARRLTGEIS